MLMYVTLISDLTISEKGERNLLIFMLCGNTKDTLKGSSVTSVKGFAKRLLLFGLHTLLLPPSGTNPIFVHPFK